MTPLRSHIRAACGKGYLESTVEVSSETMQILPEASGASSSLANIVHSDDENVKECQEGSCEVVFLDLEAGLPIDSSASVDDEVMHNVKLLEDRMTSRQLVETTYEAISVETLDQYPPCDLKALVDYELRQPLLEFVHTDDAKSSQDEEVLLNAQNKLGSDSLELEVYVQGLSGHRGSHEDAITSFGKVSGGGRMPEEEQRGGVFPGTGQESKQKAVEKKPGKQGKTNVRPSAVRRASDSAELWAKEDAETRVKVPESLDNFIGQTIRCEPYMNFTTRSGDKPLQRLRPEVFESHVAGKFSKSFKVDNGSGPSDTGTEANHGIESHASDMDSVKNGINSSSKDITGLGRVSQHSLKVPPGVVAFTQAAVKGSDLQGWLSPSKANLIKCEKCAREFCATLNYRRHVRVHRRSLNAEKEDLSKERSKVAAFWDKLSPEEARSIVCFENMEIEDLSGVSALKALISFIQQPGLPLLPQHILKAGAGLLDIVQTKASVFPLSSNRLLNMLDDASEKTFLCGGTSVAVQRFVFNGEAGKAGLEEKNLVASMGFHIELKLVKAWMADKEAEALRCQQALFKEEEAAQQKREKLLEKKRMKKIRQKERKCGSPQVVLKKSDIVSLDDEAITQGIVDEDDSPTATGSSAFSLSSAQDLALADTMELDVSDDVTPMDAQEEQLLGLGDELLSGKKWLGGADQSYLSAHQFADHRSERPRNFSSQEAATRLDRKERKEAAEVNKEVYPPLRHTNEEPGESDGDVRALQTSARSRSWRAGDVHSSSYFRKVEQERIGPDLRRLDSDRFVPERKLSRNTWDGSRNDYSESLQKLGRDFRGFDGRYGDVVPHGFKSVRNTNAYFVKGDGGACDLPNLSRLQQYSSKPSGISRMMNTVGNSQVVWTRKFPQATPVEAVISRRVDEIQDDEGASRGVGAVGWKLNEASKEVASDVPHSGNGEFDTMPEEREKEKLTTPLSTDTRFAGSESVVGSPEKILEADDEGSSGALLVGSLSVPLGKFANANVTQSRSGSYSQPVHPQVSRVPRIHTTALSHEIQDLCICTQEGGRALSIHTLTGSDEAYEASKSATAMAKADSDTPQLAVLKPHLSMLSPENGKGCLSVTATPVGQERPTAKQMPWQMSAGRYVSSKVWRPVCTAGERHDSTLSGLHGNSGDRDSVGSDKRPFQDGDTTGRKESEIGNSSSTDVKQEGPIGGQFSKVERHCWKEDGLIVANSSIGVNCNDVCVPSAPLISIRSVGSDCLSEGQVESSTKGPSDNGGQYAVLASGLYSFSSFVEVAGLLFNERWRLALAQAIGNEKEAIAADSPTDGFFNDTDGLNFLEMVFVQLADQSSRQHPGAGSLLCPSSSAVTESSIDVAKGGEISCMTFGDSDQTGADDISPLSLSKSDKLGLHGAGAQETRIPVSVPLEDATRRGETSLSPVESEQSMIGSETNSSHMTSSSVVGRVGHNRSEASVDTCGTGALAARRGYKQTMGNRYPRDGSLEQRYVARRRAPSHKNC